MASSKAALTGELGVNLFADPPGDPGSATVFLQLGSSYPGSLCSGTLIAPGLVLTAAHCLVDVVGEGEDEHGQPIDVYGIQVAIDGESWRGVEDCWVHPEALGGVNAIESCGELGGLVPQATDPKHDLVILELTSESNVAPRSIAPPRSCLESESGFAMVRGFGKSQNRNQRHRREMLRASFTSTGISLGAAAQGGDSGGTVDAMDDPEGPIIGLISRQGGVGVSAPSLWQREPGAGPAQIRNIDWIWSVIDPAGSCEYGSAGPCTSPFFPSAFPDSDGDGLPNVRDLCPTVPLSAAEAALCGNQHCDEDGDWVGDACDAYPDICNHDDADADGIPDEADPCPLLHAARHSASDVDGDGVPDACDRCPGLDDTQVDPTLDTDEDGVPDGCDNCPGIPNSGQANCNLDVELRVPAPVLGDACDPTPCPRLHPGVEIHLPNGPLGYGTSNAGVEGHGVAVGPESEGTMRTGFRWCPCAAAEEDSIRARRLCAMHEACVQAHEEYGKPSSAWRFMTVGVEPSEPRSGLTRGTGASQVTDVERILTYRSPPESDTAPGRDFAQGLLTGTWNFAADGAAAEELEVVGGGPLSITRTRGVVWAHALAYELPMQLPQVGCNVSMSCSTPNLELTSHYYSGVFEEKRGLMPSPVVDLDALVVAALLGPRACPECPFAFPPPMITRECAFAGSLCVRFGRGDLHPPLDRPVWEGVDPELIDAWMNEPGLNWLAASEPESTLRPGALRFAAYDPTTLRITKLAVLTDSGLSVLSGRERPLDDDVHGGAAQVLSGNTAQVIAFGGWGPEQAPATSARRLDLRTGARTDLPLTMALGSIRTAAVDPSGRWALVIDEGLSQWPRLVQIDLVTGSATVVATGTNSSVDRQALASMPGGNWALVASSSSWGEWAAVVFSLTPSGVLTELRATVDYGTLATSQARGSERGVSFVLNDQLGWTPAGADNREMNYALAVEALF